MSGRTPRGEGSEDSYAERRRAALNGTGKYPAVPRPQTERRVDTSPTPRIARPTRPQEPPRRGNRLILILVGVFVAGALLACYFSYVVFNYVSGLNASSGAATTADDFLKSISAKDYEQAYIDLGGEALQQQNLEHFKDMALLDDKCYGAVTNYQEVAGSATVQGDTQSYSYTITRANLSKPYQLRLTLQQGENSSNVWKVISYGNDLGPAPPKC